MTTPKTTKNSEALKERKALKARAEALAAEHRLRVAESDGKKAVAVSREFHDVAEAAGIPAVKQAQMLGEKMDIVDRARALYQEMGLELGNEVAMRLCGADISISFSTDRKGHTAAFLDLLADIRDAVERYDAKIKKGDVDA